MSKQQYDNSGSLFKNDRKETDKQPDYKGSIMVAGVEYWLSGWRKTTGGGESFLSLSATPKDVKQKPQTRTTRDDDAF